MPTVEELRKKKQRLESKITSLDDSIKGMEIQKADIEKEIGGVQNEIFQVDDRYIKVVCDVCDGTGATERDDFGDRHPCPNPNCQNGFEWRRLFED